MPRRRPPTCPTGRSRRIPTWSPPEGLAALEAELAAARAAYAAAQAGGDVSADRTAMARATRDLRYWAARRASAQLVERPAGEAGVVRFGSRWTFEREDGRRQTFRIVGEDEADPAKGAVSYVSPLARALLGKARRRHRDAGRRRGRGDRRGVRRAPPFSLAGEGVGEVDG